MQYLYHVLSLREPVFIRPAELGGIQQVFFIKGIVRGMEIRVGGREFPWLPSGHLEPVQDGMVSFFLNERNGFITHTEINKFGLIYYKEDMGSTEKKVSEGLMQGEEKLLFTEAVIEDLDMSFEAIGKFYNLVGYWGLVEVRFSLSGLLGIQLIPILPKNNLFFGIRKKINESERQLSWQTIISSSELNDAVARQKKLFELGKDVAWSFGFEITEDLIKRKLKEKGRWVE